MLKPNWMNRFAALLLIFTWGLLFPATPICWGQNQSQRKIGLPETSKNNESKFALVMGNANYVNTGVLKNPVNDAHAMTLTLREAGFEVTEVVDANQTAMKKAIRTFGEKIRNGGVGLFYYAGHGIQVSGKNYLIPVSAQITAEEEVEIESVDVNSVLQQMKAARNRLNIVILDACRNNPFSRSFRSVSRGLAYMDAPSGTIIAYATAPGDVANDGTGKNGLYTQELLRYMKEPGNKIEDVFKNVRASVRKKSGGQQTPWEASSLEGDFYFQPAGNGSATVSSSKPEGTPSEEAIFWDTIKESTDPKDFQTYLAKFPTGTYVELANNRLSKLKATAETERKSTAESLLQQAETAYQQQQYLQTITACKELLHTNEASGPANRLLGQSYFQTGAYKEASAALIKAVLAGEEVVFPVKHIHSNFALSDDLCPGKITIKPGVFEFQSEQPRPWGFHDFSVAFDKIRELSVEPGKLGRLHTKILITGKKDEEKNYNFYPAQAEMKAVTSSKSTLVVNCSNCTDAMMTINEVLQRTLSAGRGAAIAPTNTTPTELPVTILNAIKAAGGLEFLKGIKEVQVTGTTTTRQLKIETLKSLNQWQSPNKFRGETESLNDKKVYVFDGTNYWEGSKGKVKAYTDFNLTIERQMVNVFGPNLYLNFLDAQKVASIGKSQLQDQTLEGYRVTLKNGDEYEVYFDTTSLLPVKLRFTIPSKGVAEFVSSDFKDFGNGFKLPQKQSFYFGSTLILESTTDAVKINPGFSPSLFTKP